MATNPTMCNPKAVWSKTIDKILINAMLAQCRKGKKLDNGFKSDVWNQILMDFNTRRDSEDDFNIRQIKNRATLMKKQWRTFNHLLNSSGFGWNEELQVVTATDSVWNDYLKRHPAAVAFQRRGLDNYSDMSEIFSNTSATGINATTSSQPGNIFEEESLNNVIAVQEENFEEYAGSPTTWIGSQSSLENNIQSVSSPIQEDINSGLGFLIEDPFTTPVTSRPRQISTTSRNPRKRVSSSQVALHEAEKMSGYAEKIVNDLSGLVADVRASKRICTDQQTEENTQPGSALARIPSTSEFKQYAEAANIVMEMYKAGEITKEAVQAAVKGLEKRPIDCVTFVLMPRDLQLEWVDNLLAE